MNNEKDTRCNTTQSWRSVDGKICPIMSERNRPNSFGIKHKFGKLNGQLKKNKLLTKEELEAAIASASV